MKGKWLLTTLAAALAGSALMWIFMLYSNPVLHLYLADLRLC